MICAIFTLILCGLRVNWPMQGVLADEGHLLRLGNKILNHTHTCTSILLIHGFSLVSDQTMTNRCSVAFMYFINKLTQ